MSSATTTTLSRQIGPEIVPFEREHVAGAAVLAATHVSMLRQRLALVPERWTEPDAYVERLERLIEGGSAAVALEGGSLVGYLGGFGWERAGLSNVHSPEWANVSVGERAVEVRQQLYAVLAERWLAEGRTVHYIGLLPHDSAAFEALGWLGFGHSNVDGLRSVAPVPPGPPIDVRPARPADAHAVLELHLGLRDHLASTPVFLALEEPMSVADMAARLSRDNEVTLLASDERGPVAFLQIGPASNDASTIIRDEGTASITGAFTRPDRRGDGVATTLLNTALEWAREQGYVRCSVDWESANLLATQFWMRYFDLVGISVRRRI
jgi:GNAT superfamily N-acetyltransferase